MKTGKGENYLFYAARKRAMKIVQMRQMKGIFKGNRKKKEKTAWTEVALQTGGNEIRQWSWKKLKDSHRKIRN